MVRYIASLRVRRETTDAEKSDSALLAERLLAGLELRLIDRRLGDVRRRQERRAREVEHVEQRIGVRVARAQRRQLELRLDEARDARVVVRAMRDVRALRERRDDGERDAHAVLVESALRIARRDPRRRAV